MRLLTGAGTASNPILDNNFKDERITSKKRIERIGSAEIDITGELVSELLPQVLERFSCCRCPRCYAEAMSEALEAIPPAMIKIRGKNDLKRAESMKEESRKKVMSDLVRIAIKRKNLEKHR